MTGRNSVRLQGVTVAAQLGRAARFPVGAVGTGSAIAEGALVAAGDGLWCFDRCAGVDGPGESHVFARGSRRAGLRRTWVHWVGRPVRSTRARVVR